MRLSAKAPIVIRGEEITHLDTDGYKHLPRATALPDGKVLAISNGKWAPSDLSGVAVSSVFGRTGAVIAQDGDYDLGEIGDVDTTGAATGNSLAIGADNVWRPADLMPRAAIIAAGQFSGFVDRNNVVQKYDGATRVVTNEHASGFVETSWNGIITRHASPWVLPAHPATLNKTYFYYSTDGTNYAWSETAWDFEDIQVASVRYGTYLKLPVRECHGLADPEWHRDAHKHIWTYVQSGCGLTAGTYAIGGTASNANNTPGVDAGTLRDEDLPTALAALAQGSYVICTPQSGEFNRGTSSFPFFSAPGSYIQYYPSDTGSPTTGQTGKFYNVYLVGAPLMLDETGAPLANRFLWLAPQAEYGSLTAAKGESVEGLRLGDLTIGTSEYCPIRRLVFGTSAAYGTTGKVRLDAVDELERSPLRSAASAASVLSGSGIAGQPAVWVSPSSLASQDAATFLGAIGGLPYATLTGAIDANSINGKAEGLYRLAGSSYTNFPASWSTYSGGTVLQTKGADGKVLQQVHSVMTGLVIRQELTASWEPWKQIWDSQIMNASPFSLAALAKTTAASWRTQLGIEPAELLIHSDFGRNATTDVWQSAFTNNTASGLQLAANTTATGTEITIEQVVNIPADGGAAAYQVYIGPQLTGEQSPTGSTYVDVVDPNTEYGAGILRIKIELLGSGSSITGYVTSTLFVAGFVAPFVRYGEIAINGTIANSIDIRFNPDSQTAYIIRRNRVFRRNP